MALQAGQILGRLKNVMDESNRSSTLAYGELSIKIAEVVLGKEKDSSITDCPACAFLLMVCVPCVLLNFELATENRHMNSARFILHFQTRT
jgi:hypothetical protein